MTFESNVQPCRNAQCGDWCLFEGGNPTITVASIKMSDWRYEFLIQLHELVEAVLCKHKGISDEAVTAFDTKFEDERKAGLHSQEAEDGDDPRAPYHDQHLVATLIERLVAQDLDVDWAAYEKEIHERTV